VSPLALVGALPVAVFEFSLGVYLIVKGFKASSPLMTQPSAVVATPALVPAPRASAGQLDGRGAEVS
jgi:hypothetical protein